MNHISFGDSSSGSQIAINNGTVNNQFISDFAEKLPLVHEATFDSFDNQHEPECYTGTRIDLLSRIDDWVQSRDSSDSKCIFWLNGMAGTGKSTISRTVARRASDTKTLGATFFFKRGEGDRGTAKSLFTTIAHQLAGSLPELLPSIKQVIRDNPEIASKTMKEQFEKLIMCPLLNWKPNTFSSPQPIRIIIIIIDALDECEGANNIRLILQLLPQLQKSTRLRLRVFLTSRPELDIRMGFSGISDYKDFILHQIPKELIDYDLSLFLRHKISEITNERSLPADWVDDSTIQDLVSLSSPLFIFAATICRMLEDHYFDPVESLTQILRFPHDISQLDKTYYSVLNRIFHDSYADGKQQIEKLATGFRQVVGVIVMLENPLSIVSLSKFMNLPESTIRTRLDPLHSVLNVPAHDRNLPVRLFHLSFRDFLLDHGSRDTMPFSIDIPQTHLNIAVNCVRLNQQHLRKNICQLSDEGTPRVKIGSSAINRHIPPEAQYACRYWTHHLAHFMEMTSSNCRTGGAELMSDVSSFLQSHSLHWVEAMSILGVISEVVGMIDILLNLIPNQDSITLEYLRYTKRLVLNSAHIIDAAPLQIYCAALVFAPQNRIHERLAGDLPSWISKLPQIEPSWGPELQSFENGSNEVRKIVFSPDGRFLASLSRSIYVRSFPTGTLQCILDIDTDTELGYVGFRKLEFSPDSKLLAFMSRFAIRVWDPATGALRFWRFQDSKSELRCFAFIDIAPPTCKDAEVSHKGQLLVSLATDGRLILHDLDGDQPGRILKSNPGAVCSFAISCDRRFLACGIQNGTVHLFELLTGRLTATLTGHLTEIIEVRFSPDSRLLASVSIGTVRLWDPVKAVLRSELMVHGIHQTIFSPDSRTMATMAIRMNDPSPSYLWDIKRDESYEITDAEAGLKEIVFSPNASLLLAVGYFKISIWSHEKRAWKRNRDIASRSIKVYSAAFVPDPTCLILAFGSRDGLVRQWDLSDRALLENRVETNQMFLSPNGQILASNNGYVFSVWDFMTGTRKVRYELDISREHIWVDRVEFPVAFSDDNKWVAAIISPNQGILVWSMRTGALKQTITSLLFSLRWRDLPWLGSSLMLKFSNNGLLACHWDSTVIMWDVTTGAELRYWDDVGEITKLEFIDGGPYLGTDKGVLGPGEDIRQHNPFHVRFLSRRKARIHERELSITEPNREVGQGGGNPNLELYEALGLFLPQPQREERIYLKFDGWIVLNGRLVLWLPPEFRHGNPIIIAHGDRVALAHASRGILFLQFCV
ncbi:unnamed protein product [Penicillium salamii]|nr:unnamed protein product [Penicillium salamii]